MRGIFTRAFVRTHIAVYRLTGGRLGGSWGNARVLLLTTTGRRSGKPRTTPLLYLEDNGRFVVVATNDGASEHPSWYRNLQKDPRAEVQVRNQKFAVTALTVAGEERTTLWQRMVDMYPNYARDQQRTERELPVVILER